VNGFRATTRSKRRRKDAESELAGVRREKIDVDDLSLATLMLLKATNELFTLKHSFISEEAEFATQNDQHQT
jgi:hypothetical protein